MLKQAMQIVVRVEESQAVIVIEQPNGSDDPDCIIISPEQVTMLVEWLQEAKAEAEALERARQGQAK